MLVNKGRSSDYGAETGGGKFRGGSKLCFCLNSDAGFSGVS